MPTRKEEYEIKKLLKKGKVALNRLQCDWGDEKLQNLLYHYGLCKEDAIKLKKAVKILNHLGSFVTYLDVEMMKNITK